MKSDLILNKIKKEELLINMPRQKTQKETNNFKIIDLFAGIGGFRIALESFGLECVFSSEWDKYASITYKENFGEKPKGDITKIKASEIPSHNILCAGFPCQPFSISGKQRGLKDTRGTLFFDIARIAKYHKPEVLFLENVKNFEKHDKGKTLEIVIKNLNKINYDVYYRVLNASDYGAVTARKRVYIIAFRKDLSIKNFDFPNPLKKYFKLKDFLDKGRFKECEILRDDIKLSNKHIKPDLFGDYPQRPIRLGTIGKGGQGERIYSPLGHAITFSAYGGGIASKTGAYLINGKVRKLTPRECARVMGFPDDFKIPVPNTQAYKQFGNSVAVPVLKEISKNILTTLNENYLCRKEKNIRLNLAPILQKEDLGMRTM